MHLVKKRVCIEPHLDATRITVIAVTDFWKLRLNETGIRQMARIHLTTTLSPRARHSTHSRHFVPPVARPFLIATPVLASINSRPPHRGHCAISAGFGMALMRARPRSSAVSGAGVLGMTVRWRGFTPAILPPHA